MKVIKIILGEVRSVPEAIAAIVSFGLKILGVLAYLSIELVPWIIFGGTIWLAIVKIKDANRHWGLIAIIIGLSIAGTASLAIVKSIFHIKEKKSMPNVESFKKEIDFLIEQVYKILKKLEG